jgi:hypothetical protein
VDVIVVVTVTSPPGKICVVAVYVVTIAFVVTTAVTNSVTVAELKPPIVVVTRIGFCGGQGLMLCR